VGKLHEQDEEDEGRSIAHHFQGFLLGNTVRDLLSWPRKREGERRGGGRKRRWVRLVKERREGGELDDGSFASRRS